MAIIATNNNTIMQDNNTLSNADQQNINNTEDQEQNHSWVEYVSPHHGNFPMERPWVATVEEIATYSMRKDF